MPAILLPILETRLLCYIGLPSPRQRVTLHTQVGYHHYHYTNTVSFFFKWECKRHFINGLAKSMLLSIPPTRFPQHAESLQLRGQSLASLSNFPHN